MAELVAAQENPTLAEGGIAQGTNISPGMLAAQRTGKIGDLEKINKFIQTGGASVSTGKGSIRQGEIAGGLIDAGKDGAGAMLKEIRYALKQLSSTLGTASLVTSGAGA